MDWFFIQLAAVVFMSPVIIVGTYVFWMTVGCILENGMRRLFPDPPPYCDIDPRCHSAFVFAADGSGWIGGICVMNG